MKAISFKKMQGSGNDFILIDNRKGLVAHEEAPELARRLCKRCFGIGADGLILIEDSNKADFRWMFLNADGSIAEMCGNGGRCAARFAYIIGMCQKRLCFETLAGIIKAEVNEDRVKLQLTPPRDIRQDITIDVDGQRLKVDYADTGVPHVVVYTKDVEKEPVAELGRRIRYHEEFAPKGANVNFIEAKTESELKVRTYERGVEGETYACGTGAAASALMSWLKGLVNTPVDIVTSGGERLRVHLEKSDSKNMPDIYLEGKAILVYSGVTEEV